MLRRSGSATGVAGSLRRSGPATAVARLELTLLVRAYCHLCDEMRVALQPLADAAGAQVIEIDIDANPALESRWGERVPVLLLGSVEQGHELGHHRLDAACVERALKAR